MRIFKNKFYIIDEIPGISGFQRWDERDHYIVSGARAQGQSRLNVISEAIISPEKKYRLWDGHLKEFCPIVCGRDAKYVVCVECYTGYRTYMNIRR